MLVHRIIQWPCTGGTMEGRDRERDEDDENNLEGLAAVAIVLLAAVVGILTLLIRG